MRSLANQSSSEGSHARSATGHLEVWTGNESARISASASDTLAASARIPMQDPAWVQACAATLHEHDRRRFVSWSDEGGSHAMAPLVQRMSGERGRWEIAGLHALKEPSDLMYRDAEALESLVAGLASQGYALKLGRVPEDSPTILALRRKYRGRGLVVCRPAESYPYITLDSSWREPEQRLTSRRRSDFRRSWRRAEKVGPVRSEILAPRGDEVAPWLERAIDVEARSWKGETGTALAHDPRRAAFFRHYARRAAEGGSLRLAFLFLGDQVAAMQMAVIQDHRFWLLKIGFDAQFARCSPGVLLLRETIRYAAEQQLESYEMLGRTEPWLAVWTRSEKRCVEVRTYPYALSGLLALACDLGTSVWTRLARRFGRRP
ncbi:MAG: GNAT family N-acetyltransferase [Acidobacteriota bacterium]|nr:MAG: GNAT family N-acetyltransferase [Acidobacteriota bacterium]